MKSTLIVAGLITLATTLTACGGTAPSNPTSAGSGSTSAPADPSSSPSIPAITSEQLQQVLVTADDLGKPFRDSSSAAGALPVSAGSCPKSGPSAGKVEASGRAWAGHYYGKTAGDAVQVTALPTADGSAMAEAFAADLRECADHRIAANGLKWKYVRTQVQASTPKGADEVLGSSITKAYVLGAKHSEPVITKMMMVRKGNFVVEVFFQAYTPIKAKAATDFTLPSTLVEKQLAKLSELPAS